MTKSNIQSNLCMHKINARHCRLCAKKFIEAAAKKREYMRKKREQEREKAYESVRVTRYKGRTASTSK